VVSRRQLFVAKGYLSSVEHPLTFGLGRLDKAEKISIVWPSGAKTDLKDIAGGKTLKIVEPDTPTSTK
jgi:hypothetical protein